MDSKWTEKMVRARVEEAVQTLRTLHVTGLKPKGYSSSWPDVMHDPNEAYGWDGTKVRPGPPQPDAITRMDEVLEWLLWLDKDQSRLVWLHASGMARKKICTVFGMSPGKVWRMWAAALMTIASTINANMRAMQSNETRENLFRREYLRTGNASAAYRAVFPCDGLSNDIIHDRSRRLVKKHRTGDKPSVKTVSTGETGAR